MKLKIFISTLATLFSVVAFMPSEADASTHPVEQFEVTEGVQELAKESYELSVAHALAQVRYAETVEAGEPNLLLKFTSMAAEQELEASIAQLMEAAGDHRWDTRDMTTEFNRLTVTERRELLLLASSTEAPEYAREQAANCPETVPAGYTRGLSKLVDPHILCVASVNSARTDAAATAIVFTMENLSVPYHRGARMLEGKFDCSSLVMRAYAEAGYDTLKDERQSFTTRSIAPYRYRTSPDFLTDVAYEDRLPGDLLVTEQLREDGGGHVVMSLAAGLMIHTSTPGDGVNTDTLWSSQEFPYVRTVIEL